MIKNISAKLEVREAKWGGNGQGSSSLTCVGEMELQVAICVGRVIVSFDGGKTYLEASEVVSLINAMGLSEE